jgi:hypothetical protein
MVNDPETGEHRRSATGRRRHRPSATRSANPRSTTPPYRSRRSPDNAEIHSLRWRSNTTKPFGIPSSESDCDPAIEMAATVAGGHRFSSGPPHVRRLPWRPRPAEILTENFMPGRGPTRPSNAPRWHGGRSPLTPAGTQQNCEQLASVARPARESRNPTSTQLDARWTCAVVRRDAGDGPLRRDGIDGATITCLRGPPVTRRTRRSVTARPGMRRPDR